MQLTFDLISRLNLKVVNVILFGQITFEKHHTIICKSIGVSPAVCTQRPWTLLMGLFKNIIFPCYTMNKNFETNHQK